MSKDFLPKRNLITNPITNLTLSSLVTQVMKHSLNLIKSKCNEHSLKQVILYVFQS